MGDHDGPRSHSLTAERPTFSRGAWGSIPPGNRREATVRTFPPPTCGASRPRFRRFHRARPPARVRRRPPSVPRSGRPATGDGGWGARRAPPFGGVPAGGCPGGTAGTGPRFGTPCVQGSVRASGSSIPNLPPLCTLRQAADIARVRQRPRPRGPSGHVPYGPPAPSAPRAPGGGRPILPLPGRGRVRPAPRPPPLSGAGGRRGAGRGRGAPGGGGPGRGRRGLPAVPGKDTHQCKWSHARLGRHPRRKRNERPGRASSLRPDGGRAAWCLQGPGRLPRVPGDRRPAGRRLRGFGPVRPPYAPPSGGAVGPGGGR